ncbi:MAG: ParB/RepB/Spo0J family partition protein [Corallococcus sp.]|nr:ParB/RepB/Spo0J family partition protein [Corallococcus sp.]MCM1359960.1 ParB/RepB/Spo0J family partition protein [Corallococcus sp.]MCM1395516.1 ParB/RepB/Spo0J family partition protein [Corallococcus sp.]
MANKGLGRGYAALMGLNDVEELATRNAAVVSDDAESAKIESADGVVKISLSDIDPNYEQPRKKFDEDALQELADSIKTYGVIQPIVVSPIGKRFMIIAGERRFRASKLAGKTEIPAIIRNYTAQEIKEISLIENLQREDLTPIEAARAIRTLMTEFNMTQEVAADRIGKSRSAVANTLRLLTLHEGVIELIEAGRLSAGHARTLVVVPQEFQYKLALRGCDNQMTVREMEKMIREFLNPKPKAEKPKNEECKELHELVSNMQRAFATKVSAMGNSNKGRIYIDYFTSDDLDRICKFVDDWMSDKFRKEEE